jgi:hypothetical protein
MRDNSVGYLVVSGGNQEFTTKDTKSTKKNNIFSLFFVSFVLFVVKEVGSDGA